MKAVIHQKLCLCIKKKLHCNYGWHIENYESSTLCNVVVCWKTTISFLEHVYKALRFFPSWLFLLLLKFTHYQTFFTIVRTAATTNKIWPNGEKTTSVFQNVRIGRSMERNSFFFLLSNDGLFWHWKKEAFHFSLFSCRGILLCTPIEFLACQQKM